MLVIEKDVTFPFDVDHTLIFWVPRGKEPPEGALEADYYGERVFFVPHWAHIQLLKASIGRKRGTVVWSGNGYQWAKNVLAALGFKEEDDIIVMAKPAGYVDDLPCNEWMGQRIYLPSKDKLPWED